MGAEYGCCSFMAKAFYGVINIMLMIGGGVNGGMGLFILMFPDNPASVGLNMLGAVVAGVSAGKLLISLISLIGLAHGSHFTIRIGHYLWLLMALLLLVECALLGVRLHEGIVKQSTWESLASPTRTSIMNKLDCCGFDKRCSTGSTPTCAPLIAAKQETNLVLMLVVGGASCILSLLASALAKCIKRPKQREDPPKLAELAHKALPTAKVATASVANTANGGNLTPVRNSPIKSNVASPVSTDGKNPFVGSLRQK